MLDLIIRGGRVVTPWGVGQWDVAVAGEKIVAVAEPCALQDEAHRIMDASGKIVIPGGIEPHAHVASPVPGNPGATTQPPEPASRAALFGGTTSLTDFAIQHPGIDIEQAIEERTATSHCPTPQGATTRPPRMMRSSISESPCTAHLRLTCVYIVVFLYRTLL
jgi:dihydropyrimidinase